MCKYSVIQITVACKFHVGNENMLAPKLIFESIEKENLQIWGLNLQLFNYQFQK